MECGSTALKSNVEVVVEVVMVVEVVVVVLKLVQGPNT